MEPKTIDRRMFLATMGSSAAIALAGCSGGGGGGGDENSGDGNGENSGGGSGGGDGDNVEYLAEEPDYGDWLDDANEYDGTVDRRGEDEVTVLVGGGDGLAFDPPAIAVSEGTSVVWEWTGEGGQHNVVDRDGTFESDTVDDEGHTFSHTFDEAGTYEYSCTPHEAIGMKGVVHVE